MDLDVTLLENIPIIFFSVSAAIKKGREVTHAEDPETNGKHGIILRAGNQRTFVPLCVVSKFQSLVVTYPSGSELEACEREYRRDGSTMRA